MTNDTCDDNMPATVTSTVSVNVRTEEPSQVPEISTSSTFSTRTMPCHPQAVHS